MNHQMQHYNIIECMHSEMHGQSRSDIEANRPADRTAASERSGMWDNNILKIRSSRNSNKASHDPTG